MAQYKTKRSRSKAVYWLGFRLTNTAAQLLFLFSIIGIIGSLLGFIWLGISIISILSAYSTIATQTGDTTGTGTSEGLVQTYGMTTIAYFVIYFLVILAFLIFCIYTFNRTKQMRG